MTAGRASAPASSVERTVALLLAEIDRGTLAPGRPLPAEPLLAARMGVSRLTLREAVSVLRARSVLRVRRGAGTFVNPVARWSAIDEDVLTVKLNRDPRTSRHLIELRTTVERGACELAAIRRGDDDVAELRLQLERMVDAAAAADVAGFVVADLAFHDTIIAAADNPLLAELLVPVRGVLARARRETSAHPRIRTHALAHHRRILAAVAAGDPAAAAGAMAAHLEQTRVDHDRHVAAPPG